VLLVLERSYADGGARHRSMKGAATATAVGVVRAPPPASWSAFPKTALHRRPRPSTRPQVDYHLRFDTRLLLAVRRSTKQLTQFACRCSGDKRFGNSCRRAIV